MFSLKIKNIKPFLIRQSSWNSLFRGSETPYCFSYEKEKSLRQSLKRHFATSSKDFKWNLYNIGKQHSCNGFILNSYYISCSNCSGGRINGSAEADIAKIKIIKESVDPSSPQHGFLSTAVLGQKFVLWDLEIKAKCNRCDKNSGGCNIQTIDNGIKKHWNFSYYSKSFFIIK